MMQGKPDFPMRKLTKAERRQRARHEIGHVILLLIHRGSFTMAWDGPLGSPAQSSAST